MKTALRNTTSPADIACGGLWGKDMDRKILSWTASVWWDVHGER